MTAKFFRRAHPLFNLINCQLALVANVTRLVVLQMFAQQIQRAGGFDLAQCNNRLRTCESINIFTDQALQGGNRSFRFQNTQSRRTDVENLHVRVIQPFSNGGSRLLARTDQITHFYPRGPSVSYDDIMHFEHLCECGHKLPSGPHKASRILVCSFDKGGFHMNRKTLLKLIFDDQMRQWLAHPGLNRFDEDRIRLSSIFEWYAADFETAEGGTRGVPHKYAPPEAHHIVADESVPLSYLPYEWSLNDSGDLVPSKPPISAARVAHTVRQAARFGIHCDGGEPRTDWTGVQAHIRSVQGDNRERASRADAENSLSGWHDPHRPIATGIHATSGRTI